MLESERSEEQFAEVLAETQVALEDLLGQVRDCEREWGLDDRIDLALKVSKARRPARD